jgi:hypothetical protein
MISAAFSCPHVATADGRSRLPARSAAIALSDKLPEAELPDFTGR